MDKIALLKSLLSLGKGALKVLLVLACIAIVILGGFAIYDLHRIFGAENEIHGNALIQHVSNDGELNLSEDESIFFAHTVRNLDLKNESGIYRNTTSFEKLKYDAKNYDYKLFVCGQKIAANKLNGIINAPVSLTLRTPTEKTEKITFELRLIFFPDRTDLRLSFFDKQSVGFANALAANGMSIRVVQKSVNDVSFKSNGSVSAEEPRRLFSYEFNPSKLKWDGQGKHLGEAPYLIYTSTNTPDCFYEGVIFDKYYDNFNGLIFHDGLTSTRPDDIAYGGTSWLSTCTYDIKLDGLALGANYFVSFDFENGDSITSTFRYANGDEYFGYGAAPDLYENRYAHFSPVAPSQCVQEHTRHDFWGTIIGENEGLGPGYNPNNAYRIYLDVNKVEGAFTRTIYTAYGDFDVLVSPSFFSMNSTDWILAVAIYLKDPISPSMQSATVQALVDAIFEQMKFTISFSY